MLAWRHVLIWNILQIVEAAMNRLINEAQKERFNNPTIYHCSDASVTVSVHLSSQMRTGHDLGQRTLMPLCCLLRGYADDSK